MVSGVDLIYNTAPAAFAAERNISSAMGNAAPLLSARRISGCSQTTMMISVVVAVVGVAMSIFSQNMPAAIGFGCQCIISIIGVFVAESAFEGERMLGAISELNQQNSVLQQQTEKMSRALSLMQGENIRLEGNNTTLGERAKDLEEENISLIDLTKNLQKSFKALSECNKSLKNQEEFLRKKVDDLQQYVNLLKDAHSLFMETNTQFTGSVSVFHRVVSTLSETEGRFKELIGAFEASNMIEDPASKERLALAKVLLDSFQIHIQNDRGMQEQILERYKQQFSLFEERLVEVNRLNDFLMSSIEILVHIQHEMESSCKILDEQRSELFALIRSVALEKETIAREREMTSEAQSAFIALQQSILSSISSPLRQMEEMIRQKDIEIVLLRNRLEEEQASVKRPSIFEAEI